MVEIRSFRNVFDLERRIYRIDRLRLNPTGVPVRGVLYFLCLLASALAASRAPLLAGPVGAVPWYLRDLGFPGGLAALLALISLEGRPFHLAALALLRYAAGPHELAGLRPRRRGEHLLAVGELIVLPDGSDGRPRRLRYTGPGAVRIRAHGRVVELAGGARLEVSRTR
ncbi:MAG TPA: hypothetical protein VMS02_03235 [Solirubrobacteraceae bacterium]|nr:hypothetical protein [Solirubrobacteraceae bacterium]